MTLLSFWWRQAPGTLKGATWIILASVCFALMSVTIRLAANGVDPLEVVFFRNVFNLLFMLPWFLKIGLAGLRTERVGLHFIRTASSLTSMFLWFTALTMLPLAEGFEQVGRRVFPGTAGLILLEASRHSYARIRPSGHAQRVAAPVLAPQPAASVSSRGEHRG